MNVTPTRIPTRRRLNFGDELPKPFEDEGPKWLATLFCVVGIVGAVFLSLAAGAGSPGSYSFAVMFSTGMIFVAFSIFGLSWIALKNCCLSSKPPANSKKAKKDIILSPKKETSPKATPMNAAPKKDSPIPVLFVDPRTNMQNLPLHYGAMTQESTKFRETLEQKKWDIDEKSPGAEQTPLGLAALYGRAENVSSLIKEQAKIETQDSEGKTPLHNASAGGHYKTVKELLDKGASVQSKDNKKRTPLHEVASSPMASVLESQQIMSELIEKGADVNAQDALGLTPLHNVVIARDQMHYPLIGMLLDAGADPNKEDAEGLSPYDHSEGIFEAFFEAYNQDPNFDRKAFADEVVREFVEDYQEKE